MQVAVHPLRDPARQTGSRYLDPGKCVNPFCLVGVNNANSITPKLPVQDPAPICALKVNLVDFGASGKHLDAFETLPWAEGLNGTGGRAVGAVPVYARGGALGLHLWLLPPALHSRLRRPRMFRFVSARGRAPPPPAGGAGRPGSFRPPPRSEGRPFRKRFRTAAGGRGPRAKAPERQCPAVRPGSKLRSAPQACARSPGRGAAPQREFPG